MKLAKNNLKVKNFSLLTLLGATIFIFLVLGTYVFTKYIVLNENITRVEIVLSHNLPKSVIPITYVVQDKGEKMNFKTPYHFLPTKDSLYTTSFNLESKLRVIRLYFDKPSENLHLYSIKIKTKNETRSINLNEINHFQGLKLNKTKNGHAINVQGRHAFIELPKAYIYTSDLNNLYQLVLPVILVLFLIMLLLKNLKALDIPPVNKTSITLSLLFLTIYLPNPIYNIALILIGILHIRNVSWTSIKSQKINLIILVFFSVYVLNNLLCSEEGFKEITTIERFLPFLVLAIVLPSIAERKYLSLFPLSAFALGFGFLLTSIFDVYVHQNLGYISFDYFTKYLHPIYFSYLIFFSICHINFNYKSKKKYFLEFILFAFLIFSGSKMVLLLSLIVAILNLQKNRKKTLLVLPLAIIILLFPPLKNRFSDILKKEDFSILNESYIENSNDTRVNGITFRLILWRETLATMSGMDYLIGKGVTKATNKTLKNRLNNFGLLSHSSFNPHNQYVDTFWRTGTIGLLFLILIPVYCIVIGIKRKDKLIIQFSLFMFVAMCSESIFGRVNGVYFFTTVILTLMNSNKN